MEIGVFTKITPTKGRFNCKRILYSEFFPPDHSSRALFGPLHAEGAVNVTEDLSLLFQHVGEDSLSVPGVIFGAVTIHEDVLLSRVAVEIAEEDYVLLF